MKIKKKIDFYNQETAAKSEKIKGYAGMNDIIDQSCGNRILDGRFEEINKFIQGKCKKYNIYIYIRKENRENNKKKRKTQKEQLLDISNFNCSFEDTSIEVKINIHAPTSKHIKLQ